MCSYCHNDDVNFSVNYFRKAEVVIDSFHVIQWINHKISLYINNVKKKYRKKDDEPIRLTPLPIVEVKAPGKPRGPYKK